MKMQGGCSCGKFRYTLTNTPLIVHACHCRDCQRITGGAFVINIWIEKKFVEADTTGLRTFRLKAGTGKPHDVFFCGDCGTYLWSRYGIVSGECLFVRAGTLDNPAAVTPDVHIFTRSKVPWLKLPEGARTFDAAYSIDKVWPADKKERLRRNAEQS